MPKEPEFPSQITTTEYFPPVIRQPTEIEGLIKLGIERGITVESMERLMVMRRELRAEAAKEAFDTAMRGFQGKCPVIERNKEVMNKDGRSVRYRYAPIDEIVRQVQPILEEFGFSHKEDAKVEADFIEATCRVTHCQGHSETSSFKVPIDRDAFMTMQQIFASALTFAKRYAFCLAFGIMTGDTDDDSQSAGQPVAVPVPRKAPTPPPAAPAQPAAQPAPAIPTVEGRAKLIKLLEPVRQLATAYYIDIAGLLPNESLEELPLNFVPATEGQMKELHAAIQEFEKGKAVKLPWMNQSPPAKEKPAKAKKPEPHPEGTRQMEGIISSVTLKEGKKKNGEPWSLWGVKVGEMWANSFSNSLGSLAQGLKGKRVTVFYLEGQKGNELVDLVPLAEEQPPF